MPGLGWLDGLAPSFIAFVSLKMKFIFGDVAAVLSNTLNYKTAFDM